MCLKSGGNIYTESSGVPTYRESGVLPITRYPNNLFSVG